MAQREGLIENETFRAFRTLITRLIKEFEDDRSYILSNLNECYRASNPEETVKSEAKAVADKIERSNSAPSRQDAVTLARGYKVQAEEIRELNSDRAMLRALATLGTVLVSFSHEMGQLQSSLENRATTLSRLLKRHITPPMLDGVSEEMNPFSMLKDAEATDRKIKQWFKFALFSVKEINDHAGKSNFMINYEQSRRAGTISLKHGTSSLASSSPMATSRWSTRSKLISTASSIIYCSIR